MRSDLVVQLNSIMIPSNNTPPVAAAEPVEFMQVLILLAARWKLVFLMPVLLGIAAYGACLLMPRIYTANASFLPPAQSSPTSALLSSLGGALGGVGGLLGGSLKSPTDQWIAIMGSRRIADELIEKYQLKSQYGVDLLKDARGVLAARTDIRSDKSGLIRLEVDDESPAQAAQIANDYIELLRKLAQQQMTADSAQRRAFYDQEVAKTRLALEQAQQRLSGSGVSQSTLKMSPDAAVTMLAQLKAKVAAQEAEVAVLSSTMTADNAQLRQSVSLLSALREQMRQMEQVNSPRGAAADADYVELYRQFKYAETLYELMSKQAELARVEELGGSSTIQVIDAAVPPEKQSKPRFVLVAALVLLASMLLSMVWVLVTNAIAVRRRSPAFEAQWQALRGAFRRGA